MEDITTIVVSSHARDEASHKSTDVDDEDPSNAIMDAMFTTTRPRDAVSGSIDGVMNVVRGVSAGVVTMVIVPVAGAFENGFQGAAAGTVTGVFAGTILALAGALTGSAQVRFKSVERSLFFIIY